MAGSLTGVQTPKRPHPNEREILFGEDVILNFKASPASKEGILHSRSLKVQLQPLVRS